MGKDLWLDLFERYVSETGDTKAELVDVAEWAIENGHAEMPQGKQVAWVARQLRASCAAAHSVDDSGRKYRTVLSVPQVHKQAFLWIMRDDADYSEKVAHHRHIHKGIRNDVRAAQQDIAHTNEHDLEPGQPRIQLNFDFNRIQDDEEEQGAA